MTRIFIGFLLLLLIIDLQAQSSSELQKQSFELNLGIGKIGVIGNNELIYSLKNSPTYEAEYITDKGIEINSRLTSNWTFNKKHEAIVGLGFNVWSRKSFVTNGDIINNWQESSLSDRRFSGQLDFLFGYRYFLKEKKGMRLFVENIFQWKLISTSKYPGLKFSIEPGIGIQLKISDSINLLSVLSFKQPLGSASYNEVFQNSFGLRLGVNKTM